jgi:hypothetical protein
LQVVAEPFHEIDGQVGIVVVVYGSHHFLGVPGGAHFSVRVAGVEQAEQAGAVMVVEAFVGLGQQPPAPVERIALTAPMPDRLVLDPPAALIQLGVGQLAHVERVGHLHRVGQHQIEHGPIRAR